MSCSGPPMRSVASCSALQPETAGDLLGQRGHARGVPRVYGSRASIALVSIDSIATKRKLQCRAADPSFG